jgi:hypothetical protein
MKKIVNPFSILLSFLLLMQINLFAQNDNDNDNNKKYEFVKTKSVNKSYNVSSNDKLNVDNSFGKVEVHTWERNEIKVDVSIEVSASRDELAQKIIDGISVTDAQSGSSISFKTNMKGNYNSKADKSTMKVNYSISMPAGNPLHIDNEFGATTIPDYRGEVDLVSKFGSLTTGNLANVKKIQVEFGKAKFESIAGGAVNIQYSKAEFGKLSGNIKMSLDFCSGIKMKLDNALSGLDIKASYSTINLKPESGLGASYTILTSFGSLKNNSGIKFDSDEDEGDKGPKFDHKYTGRSGNGAVNIKVNTSFGSVILGEPGLNDMKEKAKIKA